MHNLVFAVTAQSLIILRPYQSFSTFSAVETVSRYGLASVTTTDILPSVEVHTIHACIVGLDMDLLDLSVFDHKCIALAPGTTKHCSAVKGKIEGASELPSRVCKETDLQMISDGLRRTRRRK